MKMLAIMLAAAAATIASTPSAAGEEAAASWPAPALGAFGDLVLDLERGKERLREEVGELEDCSSERYYCAKGDHVRIVLPRSCADVGDGRWSHAGVSLEIVGRGEERSNAPPPHDPVWWLAEEGRRDLIYLYQFDEGVTEILYDADGEIDLAALAAQGDEAVREYLISLTLAERQRIQFRNVLLLRSFGACEGEAP